MNVSSPNTREAILRTARDLMQTRSYLGFSFQDIAERVGIRKPSLYHHFPSKEALGIEVLQRTVASFERWTERTPGGATAKLDAYLQMYRQGLNPGYAMCPAGALAPGWDCIEADLRAAVRRVREVQVRWLESFTGEFSRPAHSDAARLAAYLFACCQGAMIAARMSGDPEDFDAAVAIARRQITER